MGNTKTGLQDLVNVYLQILKQLGKPPKYTQYYKLAPQYGIHGLQNKMTELEISFRDIKRAAGEPTSTPETYAQENMMLKRFAKLCSKREKIEGFYRHTLDLKDLFERAGNPPVLKVSAQPDTHAKFRDNAAWTCYLKFLEYWKPDVHLIMGDFVDCEGVSHWPATDMEPRRLVPEMKIAREMLRKTVLATPKCSTRLYIEGNHENWIMQAMTEQPEMFQDLADLDIEISLKSLLALDKFGYELFPLNDLVQIGRAHFTHGIYGGKHHAAKHLDEFKANIYYGHLHDMQEHNNTSVDGPLEAATLGCLCRLDAKFLKGKKNNWAHAHGCFEFFPDGTYTFYRPRILNGVMAYNGLVFRGESEQPKP